MTAAPVHCQRRYTRLWAVVAALCVLACVVAVASTTAAAAVGPTPLVSSEFRCQKSFESVQTFADVAATAKERNCNFHFFSVRAASVGLTCERDSCGGGLLDSCNVTLTVEADVPADVSARLASRSGSEAEYSAMAGGNGGGGGGQPRGGGGSWLGGRLLDTDDLWRYELELRPVGGAGGPTVRYRGFDSQGYSLCCDGMADHAAHCQWTDLQAGDNDLVGEDSEATEEVDEGAPRQRQLLACPLPMPSGVTVPKAGTGFTVRVARPLPSTAADGAWEALLELYRLRSTYGGGGAAAEREVLGRVLVPFALDTARLLSGGHVAVVDNADCDAAPSGALVDVSGAEGGDL